MQKYFYVSGNKFIMPKDSQDWQQSKNCLMPPIHAIFSSAIVFGVLSYGIQLLGSWMNGNIGGRVKSLALYNMGIIYVNMHKKYFIVCLEILSYGLSNICSSFVIVVSFDILDHPFNDDIFKCNFLNENLILIQISLKFVEGPIKNKLSSVEVMGCRLYMSHSLNVIIVIH